MYNLDLWQNVSYYFKPTVKIVGIDRCWKLPPKGNLHWSKFKVTLCFSKMFFPSFQEHFATAA